MASSSIPPVELFELLLLLIAVVIPLELVARKVHLPPAAALIIGGMGLALLPGGHEVVLDPDLILVLFLPPLLMASAYFTVWRDFRANLQLIMNLAVGAVAFTTAAVGIVAHAVVPSLPWAACFALGAIVSPPDAVAAKAVLQRVRLPPRVIVLLEGESLVNDASGLVLFRFAVAAAMTGTFSAGSAAVSFVIVAVGGIVIGLALAYAGLLIATKVLREVHSTIFGLLLAWTSYIVADAAGVSGVLATVACGLVVGWRQHEVFSADARHASNAVWQVVVFVLESLIFILIGLALRSILGRLSANGTPALQLLLPVGAIVLAVIVSRFAWIFPAAYLPAVIAARFGWRGPAASPVIPVVMGWAGMRGVVSLAAALSLPAAMPGRDFIQITTFAVILVTVLLQGSTLAPLIQLLGVERLTPQPTEMLDLADARARVAKAQLDAVEKLAVAEDGSVRHPRLLEQYTYRAQAAERYSAAHGALSQQRADHFGVMLAAVAAGRAELLHLHRAGQIHDQVLRALERELDMQEITTEGMRAD